MVKYILFTSLLYYKTNYSPDAAAATTRDISRIEMDGLILYLSM